MTVASRSALLLLLLPLPANAGPIPRAVPDAHLQQMRRSDQVVAFDQMREGRIRPLREIENRIVPRMGGAAYLGPEFDQGSGTYRLKFMRGGSIIWVDVDGRTGAILGRSGE